MPYINILDNCVHSIGGIKDFNIATRDVNGDPLTFPLDIIMQSGSTNTLLVSDDYDNRILTINTTQVQYRHVMPDFASYLEEEVENRQGRYYQKTLDFSLPKVNLTTQNQLKEFLFTSGGEFAVSNALVFFTDSNNQKWIGGWDIPFVLENFDLQTGERNGDNNYTLKYISKSYTRTYNYVQI